MNTGDILSYTSREEFRQWLMEHHDSAKECWVTVKKGKPSCGDGCLFYLDAVEEALCFGWIDSTNKTHGGRTLQRFSPRKKSSPDIVHAFGKNPVAWENFRKFPELYRRIRIDTIQRDKSKDIALFRKRVERLIQRSEQGEMFGAWNDYGRLLNY